MGGGTCWKPGTPLLCRNTWQQGQWLYVRLIDQFSTWAPWWYDLADQAKNEWNSRPGPEVFQWVPWENDTWVYLKYAWNGHPQLGSNGTAYATTWNCSTANVCTSQAEPMNIRWSEIYFNRDKIPQLQWPADLNLFAHEMGHALGLAHHPTTALSVMYPYPNVYAGGPNDPIDIGKTPPCYYSAYWGIRCVYNWSWN